MTLKEYRKAHHLIQESTDNTIQLGYAANVDDPNKFRSYIAMGAQSLYGLLYERGLLVPEMYDPEGQPMTEEDIKVALAENRAINLISQLS